MQLEFSGQIFFLIIQISSFMKIRLEGAKLYPCGQADNYDEGNSSFSQFCERA